MCARYLPWGELFCSVQAKMASLFPGIKERIHCSAHAERHRYPLKELSFWLGCRVWGAAWMPLHVPMDLHIATPRTCAPAPAEACGTVMSGAGRLPSTPLCTRGWSTPELSHGMLALVTAEGAPLPRGISPVLKPPVELSTHEHSAEKPSTQGVGNVQPLHTCVNDAAFNYVTTYYFFPQGMASLGTQDGPQAPGREARLCGDEGRCRQGPPLIRCRSWEVCGKRSRVVGRERAVSGARLPFGRMGLWSRRCSGHPGRCRGDEASHAASLGAACGCTGHRLGAWAPSHT